MKIYVIIDNIRSAYNVGSIFRTADGAGSCEIYICGISPTPQHIKVGKTALGATENVQWRYYKSTKEAIEELKSRNVPVYSIETDKLALPYNKIKYPKELAIVLGHETEGVNREILSMSDNIVSIPMRGKKNSLNVANAAAIMLYEITKD